jgi:hypothetical protein
MKKVIYLALFLITLSCNDGRRSSDRQDADLGDRAPATPDKASIHSDTTTSGGMNRQNQYDTLK